MKRGDLYRVYKPAGDPKLFRVFVVVSRQALIDSRFPTLVCARVYTRAEGLLTQVPVGIQEGLKRGYRRSAGIQVWNCTLYDLW